MKPLIVANWKMNPQSLIRAERLFNLIEREVLKHSNVLQNVRIIVCPPFVYLPLLKKQKSKIELGAQDCFWESGGAYTGEISVSMLKDAGCEYVIIGHSERRRYFGESDEMINKKIKAVLKAGLNPVLCVGETKKERNQGKTERILKKQIKTGLEGVPSSLPTGQAGKFQVPRFCIAYEPIWAIGSGRACQSGEVQKISLLIRKIIAGLSGFKTIDRVQILYGGSVNGKNAGSYIKAGLNGLLVGGASLKPGEFIEIIKSANKSALLFI
jgi:triosephosphate isomerase